MPRNLVALLLLSILVPATQQPALAQSLPDVTLPESNDGLPGAGTIRRYDWFRNLWKKRRTLFAQEAAQQTGAVVFFGDSITQGWGQDLRGTFGDLSVANRGISGDTTRGMLIRLKQDVLSLDPSCIVMLMGTNDLEEGDSPETIADNVGLILKAIRQHNSELPVILCKVFPSHASKKRPADNIQAVNHLTAQLVRDDSHTTVLDTWTLFADKSGDAKKSEFPDLLHPNHIGYAKWANALNPIFATLKLTELEAHPWKPDEGFTSLFNGKDLSGWGYHRTSDKMRKARERWQSRDKNAPPWPVVDEPVSFDGKTATPDGRYVAINGRLVVTTPSEGRKIQQLWTTEEFPKDFTLKLEFRATPNADSGVFIRGPQLQCRDFVLAGPYKDLEKYRPQDWNELVVKVEGLVAHCTCNGEVLEAEFKVPPSGPIGLEGDRGQIEYRHIQISK